MDEKPESRKFSRITVSGKIPIQLNGAELSEVASLGFGGLYITTSSPLSRGTLFELDLPLPDNEPPVRVMAKVVYVNPQKGMGIEFLGLNVRDAERIGVFLLLNR